MSSIGNLAILASAGSGKTFQLAHRYIRLLASENEEILPDRICAMTFTRKAAGEIFDEIAGYLVEAASDEKAARVTAAERIKLPHLRKKDFLALLRRFIDNLHRTRIGTLDSFIVGIARAFPLELGIPLDFRVMDDDSATASDSRRLALDRILSPSVTKGSAQKDFLEAFKRATFGHEEKTFGNLLDGFVKNLRGYYRLCPNEAKWGNEDVIWPGRGRPWKGKILPDLNSEADIVSDWADGAAETVGGGAAKLYSDIRSIALTLAEYGPTSAWDSAFDNSTFGRLIESLGELKKGAVEIQYSRKSYTIPDEPAKALYRLVHNLLVVEFDRALNRTRGLYDLLRQYDAVYEEVARMTGVFSFADIQYLLARPESESNRAASLITRNPGQENRLYIDYRMDCRLDHWLLDEFQDTSDLQWAVFGDLVDEIVQAPEGVNRSLFYVGDVKQAIYRWRGGNHGLFNQVRAKYGGSIEYQTMATTRRCAQPIIDFVNTVFSPPFEGLLPEATDTAWREVWGRHETTAVEEPGYVAIMEPSKGVSAADEVEARYVLTADLLKQMQPVRRGLSVGILVRTNSGGKQVADTLRRECPDMSVVHEGEAVIVENELVQALLALIAVAAHPADMFAWKYIQMTPFARLLKKEGVGRQNISRRFLADIDEGGFQQFVHDWGGKLQQWQPINGYGRECLHQLETAACEFDQSGSRDCGGFIDFVNSYSVREQATGGAVRVMTIHQAKGLEFDMVILPELQQRAGRDMAKARGGGLIRAGGASDTKWILRMPKKILAEMDDVLRDQTERENEATGFDSLCLLYVGMTRPKHGLYIITSPGSKSSKNVHPAFFVKKRVVGHGRPEMAANAELGGNEYVKLYESDPGQAGWYEARWPVKPVEKTAEDTVSLPEDYVSRHKRRPVLQHREPSRQDADIRGAGGLFKDDSSDVIDFGSAIHELFARIEWIEDADVDRIIEEWRPTSIYEEQVTKDVVEQFRLCVKSNDIRRHLARPVGRVDEPWIEKRFEVILNEELVSGAFDRVIITRDGQGKVAGAAIFDYKSSRVDETAEIDRKSEEYAPQMQIYREALAKILKLDPSAITCCLIFTRQQQIRKVQ